MHCIDALSTYFSISLIFLVWKYAILQMLLTWFSRLSVESMITPRLRTQELRSIEQCPICKSGNTHFGPCWLWTDDHELSFVFIQFQEIVSHPTAYLINAVRDHLQRVVDGCSIKESESKILVSVIGKEMKIKMEFSRFGEEEGTENRALWYVEP